MSEEELEDWQVAFSMAAQAMHNHGVPISCPWEGDLSDEELEKYNGLVAAIDAYLTVFPPKRDAEDYWMPIESAPSLQSIWVSTEDSGHGTGFMEPVYRMNGDSPWKNTYTMQLIDWKPTHWTRFPKPIQTKSPT